MNIKTMYTRRFGDLNSSFSLDLKYGKDVRDKNPDDERASLATGGTSYGARLSANGTWNINRGWLKTLRYDISGSYTGKHSWRDQDLTNAIAIYSTNMEDGTSVSNIKGGHVYDASGNELTTHSAGNMAYATMLPYFYFSHYDFYGKEINAFAKLTLNLYKTGAGPTTRYCSAQTSRPTATLARASFSPKAPLLRTPATLRPASGPGPSTTYPLSTR